MQAKPKRKKRIILIPVILAVITLIGIMVLLYLKKNNAVEMPMPYDSQNLGYDQAAQILIYTDAAFASNLCVGENNVGNENIKISNGEHAGLFSLEEGKVIFAQGIYDKIYPASVTKIMTAIVALKYGNINDTVVVSWQDLELPTGSQVAGLRIGDRIAMIELMHGLLVHSGNDAAMAIARHVAGSPEKFVELMNEEAHRIGATGTHFMNPSGLHDNNHYTTVYDIYLMLREAMNYHVFMDAMQIGVYDMVSRDAEGKEYHVTLDSTDHYLTGEAIAPKDVSVLGGKTGTTQEAGSCLAVVSQNAYGQPYISIIMGAETKDDLYRDMNELLGEINR